MSKVVKKGYKYKMIYGRNESLGLFIEIWKNTLSANLVLKEDHITPQSLILIARKHGFKIPTKV